MKIECFCEKFNLGRATKITKLTGGFMHKMFKVETEKDVYAIKVLNPEIMKKSDALNNFLISEEIANLACSKGISVSCAMKIDGNYVTKYEDNYYMVYDYIDGRVLSDDKITIEHCRKIGKILAQIHSLDYKELGLSNESREDHFYVDWEKFVSHEKFKMMKYKDEYLRNYKKYYSLLKRSVLRFNESNKYVAVCHRDMDPKNVMWILDEPVIIDWESASVANPFREVIEDALCWSGFLSNNFSEEKFKAVIEEYIKVHNIEHDRYSLICGNLVGRFGWLDYNLKRSLGIKSNDPEEMMLAENEVVKTIDEINRYVELIGPMYRIICGLTKEANRTYDKVVEEIIQNNELLRGLEYNKVNAGFTNTIYKVGPYILRICTDVDNEYRFKTEINFYEKFKGNGCFPKCIFTDISKDVVPYYYEIIEFIDGQTLYEIWYKFDESQREEMVKRIIEVIRSLHEVNVETYDFAQYIKDKITHFVQKCKIDFEWLEDVLFKCDTYFKENKFGLVHNDLHFDNFIYNEDGLKLLDFERCIDAPIDYDFRIFNRYTEAPWLWASEATDMRTVENDFENLMCYFKKYYDELREMPYLEERLCIYKLIDYLNDYQREASEELLNKVDNLIQEL